MMTDDAGCKKGDRPDTHSGRADGNRQTSRSVGDGNKKKDAQLTSFVDLGLQAALHPSNVVL